MERNIVLTGPMGSGKTSVGQALAAKLGWEFLDLDAVVVAYAGKSVNEIFAQDGEPVFRQLEQEQLALLAGQRNVVLSTGGGAVLRDENRRMMRIIGTVVNLAAPQAELVARLSRVTDRPLLQGGEPLPDKIARLLLEREQCYADSDIRIDTAGKSVEDVAAEVLARLSEEN